MLGCWLSRLLKSCVALAKDLQDSYQRPDAASAYSYATPHYQRPDGRCSAYAIASRCRLRNSNISTIAILSKFQANPLANAAA